MTTQSRRENDLAWPGFHPGGCMMGEDDPEYTLQDGRVPRATATDRFARELGCRFQAVTCRRRYIRPLTRQESWDHGACDVFGDDAVEDWAETNDFEWKNGGWRDAAGNIQAPPQFPSSVPDSWEPDEGDPSWTFCGPGDPLAVPVWYLEGPE